MRSCFRLTCLLGGLVLWVRPALGSELTVKVIDPQSAAVPGAQVELFRATSNRRIALAQTSAQGTVRFRDLAPAPLRVHVLAPGFDDAWQPVSGGEPGNATVTVGLELSARLETVVVTAARTPLPEDQTGSLTDSLQAKQLDRMNPSSAADGLRFLPGAIIGTAGRRGGLSSLFVRGGDSRYNKIIVDGVSVNEPGGTFDFGTLPLVEVDRLEFLRGTESILYGSDAMTSVVEVWSRTGTTPTPELELGADAGNYGTEHGHLALSGAHERLDYNLFADQFNTLGSGPNDEYSNSLEGANLGTKLDDRSALRLRLRHDNSATGVASAWNYNGTNVFNVNGTTYTLLPDFDQKARQNNLISSLQLAVVGPSAWQHLFTGFDYTLHAVNSDFLSQPGRVDAFGDNLDTAFEDFVTINRAGLDYQGTYSERTWAQTAVGYEFEEENGTVGDRLAASFSHGLRRNHAAFGQQLLTFSRASLLVGGRLVENQSFGRKFVPRAALTVLAFRGGGFSPTTRLRFAYGEGIKEPAFSESFGTAGGFPIEPNPLLRPEETRALEAGVAESFGRKYSLTATYFNNLFRNKIDFNFAPCFCTGQYVNVNEAMAHGAEVEAQGRPIPGLEVTMSYVYTSTQILKEPLAFDPLLMAGQPLLRRPRHSATALATYGGQSWGADLAGSFVGRRPDSDFLGFGIEHAPSYVRLDAGAWRRLRPSMTAYVNLENVLNRFYEEVTGYPALGFNFRAGVRFRVGGE
ncbi:MAG: TonB-dependent receptor [Acidobacteria bacterium]|nr:TonB-dependent receptor [Acidobacteriota bacterium]